LVSKFEGLSHLKGKRFFSEAGAVSENGEILYLQLMNFLGEAKGSARMMLPERINEILSDPIKNSDKMKVLQAIIVLNNFDKML
jgi:hypothetical protein